MVTHGKLFWGWILLHSHSWGLHILKTLFVITSRRCEFLVKSNVFGSLKDGSISNDWTWLLIVKQTCQYTLNLPFRNFFIHIIWTRTAVCPVYFHYISVRWPNDLSQSVCLQAVSTGDVRREITFCKKVGVPILGIVENMSGFVCPHCSVGWNTNVNTHTHTST